MLADFCKYQLHELSDEIFYCELHTTTTHFHMALSANVTTDLTQER